MADLKVPIGDRFVVNLDAPTVAAYERRCEDGRVLWGVWCGHCQRWHWHGPGEGHRVAHCHDPASPYERHGYNLVLAGAWAEDPAK